MSFWNGEARRRCADYRVIAEGDDTVGRDLTFAEALAVLELTSS
jgi:hypothetical protein